MEKQTTKKIQALILSIILGFLFTLFIFYLIPKKYFYADQLTSLLEIKHIKTQISSIIAEKGKPDFSKINREDYGINTDYQIKLLPNFSMIEVDNQLLCELINYDLRNDIHEFINSYDSDDREYYFKRYIEQAAIDIEENEKNTFLSDLSQQSEKKEGCYSAEDKYVYILLN
jgi:hypothetical protein